MNEDMPHPEEWRNLYDATQRVKELAPWAWMAEHQIFGLRDLGSGEWGFVSVMGMVGMHFAVSVYLGAEGLHRFLEIQEAGEAQDPFVVFETPQIQVSFEDRDQLEKRDREVIRALGLKFRGAHQWPLFRSIRAGFAPWFLEPGEVRFLTAALEQLLDVAPRVEIRPDLLRDPAGDRVLTRVPTGSGGAWEDRWEPLPLPDPAPIPLSLNPDVLRDVQAFPRSANVFEADLFLLPARVAEGERPIFPYILLVADRESGVLVGFEMLTVETTLSEMLGHVPGRLLDLLLSIGGRPAAIHARSDRLAQLLEPVAKQIDVRVKRVHGSPALDRARDHLLQSIA